MCAPPAHRVSRVVAPTRPTFSNRTAASEVGVLVGAPAATSESRAPWPEVAVRLLKVGLVGATTRDTLWAGGAHMLTDALLEQAQDTLAALWSRVGRSGPRR